MWAARVCVARNKRVRAERNYGHDFETLTNDLSGRGKVITRDGDTKYIRYTCLSPGSSFCFSNWFSTTAVWIMLFILSVPDDADVQTILVPTVWIRFTMFIKTENFPDTDDNVSWTAFRDILTRFDLQTYIITRLTFFNVFSFVFRLAYLGWLSIDNVQSL